LSAVRGGTIVGQHEVVFAGPDEVIEIRHTAQSRDIYATGVLRAVSFVNGQVPGLYTMTDVIDA
jgi:4-hydroxy-tetrahydrodipicolinate reductase